MSLRQAVALKIGMGDATVTIWKTKAVYSHCHSISSERQSGFRNVVFTNGKVSVSRPEGPEVFGVKPKDLQHLMYSVFFP